MSTAEPGDPSLDLVRRCQAGDREAWSEIYRRYHDPLLLAIRSRLGGRLRARMGSEDVLQSVLEDALREIGRFEPRGPGSLGHYLHVCVLNKIRARGSARGASEEALDDSALDRLAGTTEEPRYLDGERFELLEQALARLPESLREVVLLRSVEGLSNQEAADVLEKSAEATSKLYHRALARLGSALGGGAARP